MAHLSDSLGSSKFRVKHSLHQNRSWNKCAHQKADIKKFNRSLVLRFIFIDETDFLAGKVHLNVRKMVQNKFVPKAKNTKKYYLEVCTCTKYTKQRFLYSMTTGYHVWRPQRYRDLTLSVIRHGGTDSGHRPGVVWRTKGQASLSNCVFARLPRQGLSATSGTSGNSSASLHPGSVYPVCSVVIKQEPSHSVSSLPILSERFQHFAYMRNRKPEHPSPIMWQVWAWIEIG